MKIALITGASSGIGWAIAQELAARKCPLLLISNQEQALQDCQKALESQYQIPCFSFCIDLSLSDAAQQIFEHCQKQDWQVDVLINNAGILLFSEVAAAPIEKINTILQLHINTPTLLCRLFGAEMKKNKDGHILNVSSISSVMPYPGISIYGPSKTYMRYFSRALRSEMKMYGVNVTCLIPGATITALYDPNRVNISLAKKLGVMGTAESVAQQAVRALIHRKAECVPGFLNKLTMFFVPWVPSWLIMLLHRKTNLINKGKDALG